MEAKDEDVLTQEISKDKTYWTCVHRENCLMNGMFFWGVGGVRVFPQCYIILKMYCLMNFY